MPFGLGLRIGIGIRGRVARFGVLEQFGELPRPSGPESRRRFLLLGSMHALHVPGEWSWPSECPVAFLTLECFLRHN